MDAIKQIYAESAFEVQRILTNGICDKQDRLVGVFQDIHARLSHELEQVEASEFGKAWVVTVLAREILKYSIEDDYVDLESFRNDLASSFLQLLQQEELVNSPLNHLLHLCRGIEQAANLENAKLSRIHFETPLREQGTASFPCRVTPPGAKDIQVSSKSYPCVPVIEDSITDPEFVSGVLEAFVQRFEDLRSRVEVDCLCFVEKAIGPVGTISMVSSLVERLKLPACIYRAGYWSRRTQIAGFRPTAANRVCIIYDLIVSGDGVKEVAEEIKKSYGATVVGVIVLFSYDDNDFLEYDSTRMLSRPVELYSNFEDAMLTRRSGKLKSGRFATVQLQESNLSSPGVRRAEVSPKHGEEILKSAPEWKGHIGLYKELTALEFASDDDFSAAMELLHTEKLSDLPFTLLGCNTVVVPAIAVEWFSALSFREVEVTSPQG